MTKDFAIELNRDSKITIIFVQGGPSTWMSADPSKSLKDVPVGLKGYYWLTKHIKDKVFKDYNFVQFKQVQNIYKLNTLTKLKAIELQQENAKNLNNIIHYYKSKNNKVILFGQSYGGYLIQEYISIFGVNLFDLAIVGNSRLDIPMEFSKNIEDKQKLSYFNLNNKIDITKSYNDPLNLKFLLSVLTSKKYTQELKEKDLSKVMFVTCEGDKVFGSYSEAEKKWMQNTNGTLIYQDLNITKKIAQEFGPDTSLGDVAHRSVFHDSILLEFVKRINTL